MRLQSRALVYRRSFRSFSYSSDDQDDFFIDKKIYDKLDAIVDYQNEADMNESDDQEVDPELFISSRITEAQYETENIMRYDQKFLDKVKVFVYGGNGGQGSCAFNRENYQS